MLLSDYEHKTVLEQRHCLATILNSPENTLIPFYFRVNYKWCSILFAIRTVLTIAAKPLYRRQTVEKKALTCGEDIYRE